MRRLACGAAFIAFGCASAAPPPLPQPDLRATDRAAAMLAPPPPKALAPAPTRITPAQRAPAVAPRPLPSSALSIPAVSQGDIGGSGPLELLAASTSAAWVAVCEGEPRTAKLVLGAGAGEVIDSLDAADPSGRYVVVTRADQTQLIDAISGLRVDLGALGADLRRVRADYAPHRSLAFDADGTRLAYVRQRGKAELVVRDLVSGHERTFAAGAGEIFRVRFSADARYLELETLRDDSNKNGKLDWPAPEETSPSACAGQHLLRYRSFGYQGRGDAVTRGIVDLSDGTQRDVPDLVTTLGARLLVRGADGSLQLDASGKRQPLVPASCAARVVFADAERGLVLATCQPPKRKGKNAPPPTGKAELWLFGPGFSKNLQSELYETSVDRASVVGARLVAVYPGSAAALLDLDRRELVPLAAGSRVLSTVGASALLWRESELYLFDAAAKSEQRLARGVSKNPDLFRAGSTVLLSPFVVVGARAPALEVPLGAVAVSAFGHALVAASNGAPTSQTPSGVTRGPLHWVDARLPPPDGPPR